MFEFTAFGICVVDATSRSSTFIESSFAMVSHTPKYTAINNSTHTKKTLNINYARTSFNVSHLKMKILKTKINIDKESTFRLLHRTSDESVRRNGRSLFRYRNTDTDFVLRAPIHCVRIYSYMIIYSTKCYAFAYSK